MNLENRCTILVITSCCFYFRPGSIIVDFIALFEYHIEKPITIDMIYKATKRGLMDSKKQHPNTLLRHMDYKSFHLSETDQADYPQSLQEAQVGLNNGIFLLINGCLVFNFVGKGFLF